MILRLNSHAGVQWRAVTHEPITKTAVVGGLHALPRSQRKNQDVELRSDSPVRTGTGNTNAEALPRTHNEAATVENFMIRGDVGDAEVRGLTD